MSDTILQRQSYKAGDVIFKDGEEGNLAYILQAGEVEIVKEIEGKLKTLARIGEGGIFGEMALIDSKPRMAQARAGHGGATVILVTRGMFESKMAKTDPFIRGLLKIFVSTIRRIS